MNKKNILLLLSIIILFLIINLKKEFFKNQKYISICVCVPCFPRDTNKLPILINSINKQTILPDEIIIGHSEMNNIEAQKLKKKLKNSKIPLKVVNTIYKKFAGGNRNLASKYNKCDYITFIDADDIMIENKIEILKKYIKIYKPLSIIHNHTDNKNYKYNNLVKKIILGKKIFNTLKKKKPLYITSFKVHHGHITVHKNVLENVKQREDYKWKRGQDSKFIRDINNFYGGNNKTMIYLDIPLSIYIEAKYQ